MIDNPRVDLTIARYGRSLVIALVVLGLVLALGAGWVVANPPTTTETTQVGEETVSTSVATSAVVVDGELWEPGTALEDSSVYLLESTPELTLEPRTEVPTDSTSVTHDLAIRYEAARDGTAFWDAREPILDAEATVNDGVATTAATIDVREVLERKHDVERELGGVGSVTVSFELLATYDTGSNTGEHEATSRLHLTEEAYWLESPLTDSRTHTEDAVVERTGSPDYGLVGVLALLAVGVFGAAGFVARRGSSIDVETARRALHERRYAQWISRGTIPMWIGDHHVALDTLEDVVDVAIDTNERVVHDRQRGLFAVVDDNVVYYYSDRGNWGQTAWPDIDLGRGAAGDGVDLEEGAGAAVAAGGETDGVRFDEDELPDPDADDAWQNL